MNCRMSSFEGSLSLLQLSLLQLLLSNLSFDSSDESGSETLDKEDVLPERADVASFVREAAVSFALEETVEALSTLRLVMEESVSTDFERDAFLRE